MAGLVIASVAFMVWPHVAHGLTAAQRLTAAFAVPTAIGAVVALVVNLRKQDLTEGQNRRAIAAAFTELFRSASEQLGREAPAERLAGAYAMAALADEYPERAQQCVSVLCGYLRLPCDPDGDTIQGTSTSITTTRPDHSSETQTTTHTARPFDLQVRETIGRLIAAHLKPTAPQSWSALDFDLTGATLVNARFTGATFTGNAGFVGATFTGNAGFVGATFARFDKVTFTSVAGFTGAAADGCRLYFDNVVEQEGSAILGIETMTLLNGAQVLRNGTPFIGRDLRVPLEDAAE